MTIFLRFLEISLSSLLTFLPFCFLAIYPLRRHLRFSKAVTGVLIGLICAAQILFGHLVAFSVVSDKVMSITSTIIYALFFLLIMKDSIGRLVFVLLVFSNVANLVAVFSKCLEGLIFGDIALQSYRWTQSVCMLIFHILITLPLAFYVHKYFVSGIPIKTKSWTYLWIVPATFYAIWYYHLYFSSRDTLTVALDFHNALFLLVVNLGAFVVYHTSILLLLEQSKVHKLEHENQLLVTHKLQYDNLQHRINEARQAKHDVRHHVLMIREYLHDGKLHELEAYLDSYAKSLPDQQSIMYCRHYATNMLLAYFVQQAQKAGIEMDVFVQLPEHISIPETVLSVVLGNLLENAVDACSEIIEDKKKITVRGKYEQSALFFEITNTYTGDLRKNASGTLLSTKAAERGIGLNSVEHIANTMGGMLELDVHDNIFRASILLPEQKTL